MYYAFINNISLHTDKLKAITIESTDCYLQNDLIKTHLNEKYRNHFGYIQLHVYISYVDPECQDNLELPFFVPLFGLFSYIKNFRYITNNVIWRNFFILMVSSIDTADCFRKRGLSTGQLASWIKNSNQLPID